ncbi:MAG: hypothetical protein GY742_17585 [Hyphomicrobiales bacterium]|nr:hypothetical protein [Hyphomicrobiales bacterium]
MSGDVAHWTRFDALVGELFDIGLPHCLRNQFTPDINSQEIHDFITIDNPGWNT